MPRSHVVVAVAFRGLAIGTALALSDCATVSWDPPPTAGREAAPVPPALAGLPAAQVQVDPRRHDLVIELPALDVGPAAAGMEAMALTPLCRVDVPVSGFVYRYRVEMVDSSGQPAGVLLHHFKLTDPSRRELFLPVALLLLAAGRETPAISVPSLFMGIPVHRGQVLLAGAMVTNVAPVPRTGVRVRLIIGYVPSGRPWPLYRAYPFGIDVLFPLGHPPAGSKMFDLPPGRTVRSWEGRPAVPGTVLGVGGHLHDYGVSVEFTDVTARQVLWHGTPVRDSLGRVLSLPVARFYSLSRMGVHIVPSHLYRVTATYENPTGRLLCDGGMGSVGGLFVPDPGARWPAVDTTDTMYRQDLHDTLEENPHDMQAMMEMDRPC